MSGHMKNRIGGRSKCLFVEPLETRRLLSVAPNMNAVEGTFSLGREQQQDARASFGRGVVAGMDLSRTVAESAQRDVRQDSNRGASGNDIRSINVGQRDSQLTHRANGSSRSLFDATDLRPSSTRASSRTPASISRPQPTRTERISTPEPLENPRPVLENTDTDRNRDLSIRRASTMGINDSDCGTCINFRCLVRRRNDERAKPTTIDSNAMVSN